MKYFNVLNSHFLRTVRGKMSHYSQELNRKYYRAEGVDWNMFKNIYIEIARFRVGVTSAKFHTKLLKN